MMPKTGPRRGRTGTIAPTSRLISAERRVALVLLVLEQDELVGDQRRRRRIVELELLVGEEPVDRIAA